MRYIFVARTIELTLIVFQKPIRFDAYLLIRGIL